jgi:pimeloyl-ACP methyl ester carboxylesterase
MNTLLHPAAMSQPIAKHKDQCKYNTLSIPVLQPHSAQSQRHGHRSKDDDDDIEDDAAVNDADCNDDDLYHHPSDADGDVSSTKYRIHAKELVIHDSIDEADDGGGDDENTRKQQQQQYCWWTLVIVHGGPGIADHTELCEAFDNETFGSTLNNSSSISTVISRIVFFDQLGCGHQCGSDDDHYPIPQFDSNDGQYHYSLDGHVNQLHSVLTYLHLKVICNQHHGHHSHKIAVLGYSWGGQILLEYILSMSSASTTSNNAARTASELSSSCCLIDAAIISNSPLDSQTYSSRQLELRMALDDDTRQFYEQVEMELLQQQQQQQQQALSPQQVVGSRIYHRLIGRSDTNITGEMKDWNIWGDDGDVVDRLWMSLVVPRCLFICTKDDTVPWQDYYRLQQELVNQSRPTTQLNNTHDHCSNNHHDVVIMPEGGHAPFFGPTSDDYFQHITKFLSS